MLWRNGRRRFELVCATRGGAGRRPAGFTTAPLGHKARLWPIDHRMLILCELQSGRPRPAAAMETYKYPFVRASAPRCLFERRSVLNAALRPEIIKPAGYAELRPCTEIAVKRLLVIADSPQNADDPVIR